LAKSRFVKSVNFQKWLILASLQKKVGANISQN